MTITPKQDRCDYQTLRGMCDRPIVDARNGLCDRPADHTEEDYR